MKMTKDISSIRFEGQLYNFNARRKQRKHLTMRTESEDCCQLLRPENRKWQEPNDAKTQKIQEEPAAAYVTPEMREQPKSSSTVQHQKARRRQQSHRTPMKVRTQIL
jgi:hypothetical protein